MRNLRREIVLIAWWMACAVGVSSCASTATRERSPPPARAHKRPPMRGDAALDPGEAEAAIARVLAEIEEKYVDRDRAAKVLPELRRRWSQPAIAGIPRAAALAEALNADLDELLRDGHVRVRVAREGPMPSPDEMERLAAKRHFGVRRVEVLDGNVGYLRVDEFAPARVAGARRAIADAMRFVADTDALVIDLRHNHGGDPDAVANLVSYFVDGEVVLLERDDPFMGGTMRSVTSRDVEGPDYGSDRPIYVLISARTFSGGEDFAYDMQGLKRATLVGETTGGGANLAIRIRLTAHLEMSLSTGKVTSPFTGTSWEGVGVKPDVAVDADRALDAAHQLAIEKLGPER